MRRFRVSSFQLALGAAAPRNIMSITLSALVDQTAGYNVTKVAIRKIRYSYTSTSDESSRIIVARPTAAPTGGTALTPQRALKDGFASQCVVLFATASDLGAITAITATAGTAMAAIQTPRTGAGAGAQSNIEIDLLDGAPVILCQGFDASYRSLLIQHISSSSSRGQVDVEWDEVSV